MRWFRKKTWRYVGTVEGHSTTVDEDGKETVGGRKQGYWILRERTDGERRAKLIGHPGHSAFSNAVRARVEAWLAGGPLPDLENKPQRTAELKVFPGGAA